MCGIGSGVGSVNLESDAPHPLFGSLLEPKRFTLCPGVSKWCSRVLNGKNRNTSSESTWPDFHIDQKVDLIFFFLLDVIWPGNCLLHESQRDLEESASHQ